MKSKTLVIGASGQIGTELTHQLRVLYGFDQVIATDIQPPVGEIPEGELFEVLDATDGDAVRACVEKHQIGTVYLLAAMLSATAEKAPRKAWDLNMNSLLIVLDLAKDGLIDKIFWPSSIAVFGPTSPKQTTPQACVMEPTTVYGISKLAGENWCSYYQNKYDVDVRSIRYPGLISWKALPGGGTTDYAIAIFHEALKTGSYNCFLTENTVLPMMHMDDALRATLELMHADLSDVNQFKAYNIAGLSFSPKDLSKNIQTQIPNFKILYQPDFRQSIADSWPSSIDDSEAAQDWKWKAQIDLDHLTSDMINNLKTTLFTPND
jgi:nucleoside-diphosphate-sugar epimerase